MNKDHCGQLRTGTGRIDGEEIEFWWPVGSGFISAQFTSRCPRGIANLTQINQEQPTVVPLSNATWLAHGDREADLTQAGQALYDTWTSEHRDAQDAAGEGRSAGQAPTPIPVTRRPRPGEQQ